jgi:hypothetical protein
LHYKRRYNVFQFEIHSRDRGLEHFGRAAAIKVVKEGKDTKKTDKNHYE